MRIGNLEGSPEEIKDLCENHGLEITDYIDRPRDLSISNRWVVTVVGTYALLLVVTILAPSLFPLLFGVLSLLTLAAAVAVAVCVQLRFNNNWASGLALFGLTIVWLIAIGALAPAAAVEFFSQFSQQSGRNGA